MLQTEGSELQNTEQVRSDKTQLNQSLSVTINSPTVLTSTHFDIEFSDNTPFNNPLMDSAELYRQIVDTSHEGIWVCDLNSRLVFSNQQGAMLLGYTCNELIGRSVFDFVSYEGSSKAESFFERRKQGFNDQYEQKLVHKDGSFVWVTITASPIKDQTGNIVGALGMLNDISQRKITELALMKSEEKFSAAFRTSPNCLTISNIDTGVLLDINDTFLSLFECTRQQVIGKNVMDLNLYSNPGERVRIIEILKQKGRVTNYGLKVKVPSGKEKSVRISVEKLPLEDHNVILTTIQDLTELTQVKSNLKQSEELFRNLVDSANSIILRWRADGTIVYMNDYGFRYFGYSPGDLIGQHAGILIPDTETSGKNLTNLADEIIQNPGNYIQLENENVRKNGERVWVSWTNKAIYNEGKQEILAIGNDITHLKKTKEALRIEHGKLQAIIQNMGIGVIVSDNHGDIITLNTAAMKIHDYQSEEEFQLRKNKYFEDFELRTFAGEKIPFEDWPNLQAIGGNYVKSYDALLFNRRTDSSKYLNYNVSPVYDDNNKLKYTIFNINDLSETRKFNLMQNIELQKAKEKAEESVRFKNAFIANISHEIRTPMSGILGFADLLKTPDLSSESKNIYIETIISSGKRMLGIINDLIYISKIEAGHLETYKDATDLHKILDELKIFFQPEAQKKNLELRINSSIPLDKIITETDKTKLSQVLTNLIKNAIKYTNTGYIEFGCRLKENFYIFYVKDSGIGIEEEHQINIFERFKQGEVSIEAIEGLGLGLAISKSLVEVLGGSIWVESEPGAGSTFYFSIPYKEHEIPVNSHIQNNTDLSQSFPELEILIAEDEEFIYYFLDQFLKKNNIKTLHAKNGHEAIEMTKANPNIKLILMDSRMPVMNGLEATLQINQFRPDLPIIALSAFASSVDVQKTLKAGCVDYIVKPFEKEIVLKKILMYTGNSITHQT